MALLRLTVSQLNAYVQRTLQSDALLRDVEVSGEIGNFKLYGSGMLFFSLRDAQATLPCVMFAEDASRLSAAPCDGMRVIARGSAGLYAKGGQYRMTVREMHAEGVGPLYERLQQLRARLEREVGRVFEQVLCDCGVFPYTDAGAAAFGRYLDDLQKTMA